MRRHSVLHGSTVESFAADLYAISEHGKSLRAAHVCTPYTIHHSSAGTRSMLLMRFMYSESGRGVRPDAW
jgi:hypothetical protein